MQRQLVIICYQSNVVILFITMLRFLSFEDLDLGDHDSGHLRKEIGRESFDNYFHMISHSKGTRNNNISIKLPKIKLEVAKQGFYFGGAKLFNGLPLTMRISLKLN